MRETSANLDRYFTQDDRESRPDDNFIPEAKLELEESKVDDTLNLKKQATSSSQFPTCRICLSEEDKDEGHELISPCLCSGSLAHIGLSCLREWLEGKKHCKETDHVNSYIWK